METGKSGVCREAEGGFYTGSSSPGHDFDFGRFERAGEYTRAKGVENCKIPESGTIKSENFYNTGYYLLGKNYGSYRYQGEWQTLDHIIVSGNLLNGKADLQVSRRMGIYDADFLLEEERGTFGVRPKPTYRGPSLHWRI